MKSSNPTAALREAVSNKLYIKLYSLVGPQGDKLPKRPAAPVSALYQGLKVTGSNTLMMSSEIPHTLWILLLFPLIRTDMSCAWVADFGKTPPLQDNILAR